MLRKKNLAFAFVAVILLVIVAIILLNSQKKDGVEVSQLGIREIVGNTVEERLANHIDISSAKITKIESIEELKKQYSAIFKDAKSGNYVVELPDRLLIYDFEHDEIIAEFYVQDINLGEKSLK